MIEKKNMDKRILLVEDNEKIMQGNKRMLEWEGYTVDVAMSIAEANTKRNKNRPDCIVLDIMLPDGSGLDFMRQLRESTDAGIPILLLTGLNAQADILRGLQSGGDDYLTKPYDFPILLARVEALLRRSERVPERITKGRLTLDMSAGIAFMDGVDLLLAKKEFTLLLIFVQHPERMIDGEYLYEKVWNQPMSGDANA
ncbi:MAG: response regulator transcription factor, partial [Anaerovorax sp.]|nr:response regulator transcription factor [Anaerovorax sp.]